MKISVFVLCGLAIGILIVDSIAQAAGRSELKIPSLKEMGDVLPRSHENLSLQVANMGDAPIKIIKVVPSCTCTLLKVNNPILKSHQSGTIDVTINVPDSVGSFEASIAVQTLESGVTYIAETKVRYNIQPVIMGVPSRMAIWITRDSLPWNGKFKVLCTKEGEKIQTVRVKSPVSWLRCSVGATRGDSLTVDVQMDKMAPDGMFEIPIEVEVTLANNKKVYHPRVIAAGVLKGNAPRPSTEFISISENDRAEIEVDTNNANLFNARFLESNPDLVVRKIDSTKWGISASNVRKGGANTCVIFSDNQNNDKLCLPVYVSPLTKTL